MLTYNERNTQEQSIFYVTAQAGAAVVKEWRGEGGVQGGDEK